MYRDVRLPIELVNVQYIDFRGGHDEPLAQLLQALPQPPHPGPRLPEDLAAALDSKDGYTRRGAVAALIDLAGDDDPALVALARVRLEQLSRDDPDERVRGAAQRFFGQETPKRVRQPEDSTPRAGTVPRPDPEPTTAKSRRVQPMPPPTQPARRSGQTWQDSPLVWIGAALLAGVLLFGLLTLAGALGDGLPRLKARTDATATAVAPTPSPRPSHTPTPRPTGSPRPAEPPTPPSRPT
jgi:hypothetical protein